MKAEILQVLEPELSERKQKVRTGQLTGFLQYGASHLHSLMSNRAVS